MACLRPSGQRELPLSDGLHELDRVPLFPSSAASTCPVLQPSIAPPMPVSTVAPCGDDQVETEVLLRLESFAVGHWESDPSRVRLRVISATSYRNDQQASV